MTARAGVRCSLLLVGLQGTLDFLGPRVVGTEVVAGVNTEIAVDAVTSVADCSVLRSCPTLLALRHSLVLDAWNFIVPAVTELLL